MDVKIAGLDFELIFCNKVNGEPIKLASVPRKSAANVYPGYSVNSYIVNIYVTIPQKLKPLDGTEQSGLYLMKNNDDNILFLQYNGIRRVGSSIDSSGNMLNCRDFNVIFNEDDPNPTLFDLYHIQVKYTIDSQASLSAEAIYVTLTNEDPETERGTITASSQIPQ